jgi:hypothetical protein
MLALVVGGAVAGLLGAILALPITAAARDVYRHLFGRLSVPVDRSSARAVAGPVSSSPAPAEPVPAAPPIPVDTSPTDPAAGSTRGPAAVEPQAADGPGQAM